MLKKGFGDVGGEGVKNTIKFIAIVAWCFTSVANSICIVIDGSSNHVHTYENKRSALLHYIPGYFLYNNFMRLPD